MDADRLEDIKYLPRYKQGSIRSRAIPCMRGLLKHPERRTDRPEKGITGDNHQVDQSPHSKELKVNDIMPTSHDTGTGRMAGKMHHHQSSAARQNREG